MFLPCQFLDSSLCLDTTKQWRGALAEVVECPCCWYYRSMHYPALFSTDPARIIHVHLLVMIHTKKNIWIYTTWHFQT